MLPGAVADALASARAITEAAEAKGRARALEAARAELAVERLEAMRARHAGLEALAAQTRELAWLAAEHLVQAELTLAPERITAIVDGLLERVRRAERAVVRAHPDDLPELAAFVERARLEHVALEADPSVGRGGCVVATPIGTLDASLPTRIAALRAALDKPALRAALDKPALRAALDKPAPNEANRR